MAKRRVPLNYKNVESKVNSMIHNPINKRYQNESQFYSQENRLDFEQNVIFWNLKIRQCLLGEKFTEAAHYFDNIGQLSDSFDIQCQSTEQKEISSTNLQVTFEL